MAVWLLIVYFVTAVGCWSSKVPPCAIKFSASTFILYAAADTDTDIESASATPNDTLFFKFIILSVY